MHARRVTVHVRGVSGERPHHVAERRLLLGRRHGRGHSVGIRQPIAQPRCDLNLVGCRDVAHRVQLDVRDAIPAHRARAREHCHGLRIGFARPVDCRVRREQLGRERLAGHRQRQVGLGRPDVVRTGQRGPLLSRNLDACRHCAGRYYHGLNQARYARRSGLKQRSPAPEFNVIETILGRDEQVTSIKACRSRHRPGHKRDRKQNQQH